MSLRLAFDLDGVFADLGAYLADPEDSDSSAEGADPRSETRSSHQPTDPVTTAPLEMPFDTVHLRGASRKVWKRLASVENFWETLDEIEEGSLRHLEALARERRWEVIFLTSRPDTVGDSVQLQSQRWLERRGFSFPSVFVTRGSRGKVAAALSLDLVVDDNPENCLDVATDSEARAILLWRGSTEAVPTGAKRLGIGSVASVAECLRLIDKADRAQRGGGRFVEAFRRLFGVPRAAVGGR